jgi:hypothetical protein
MKIIVGIIASDNENYLEFKNNWIQNIINVKNDPYLKDLFDFYFLYSDSKYETKEILNLETNQVLYIDFYESKDQEEFENITHSLFSRTIAFFEYMIYYYQLMKDDMKTFWQNKGLFFLRTNLSTVFNFKLMSEWFHNKPKTNFFAGSINGLFNGLYTTMSGTNLIFSYDVILFLTNNKQKIDMSLSFEDEAISHLLILNMNLYLINIKRLDFVEMKQVQTSTTTWSAIPNSIRYHKAVVGDQDIFTFRFKTFNRHNDIIIMRYVIDSLWDPNFQLNTLIENISKLYHNPIPISQESPEYAKLYSNVPFQLIRMKSNNKNVIYQKYLH